MPGKKSGVCCSTGDRTRPTHICLFFFFFSTEERYGTRICRRAGRSFFVECNNIIMTVSSSCIIARYSHLRKTPDGSLSCACDYRVPRSVIIVVKLSRDVDEKKKKIKKHVYNVALCKRVHANRFSQRQRVVLDHKCIQKKTHTTSQKYYLTFTLLSRHRFLCSAWNKYAIEYQSAFAPYHFFRTDYFRVIYDFNCTVILIHFNKKKKI